METLLKKLAELQAKLATAKANEKLAIKKEIASVNSQILKFHFAIEDEIIDNAIEDGTLTAIIKDGHTGNLQTALGYFEVHSLMSMMIINNERAIVNIKCTSEENLYYPIADYSALKGKQITFRLLPNNSLAPRTTTIINTETGATESKPEYFAQLGYQTHLARYVVANIVSIEDMPRAVVSKEKLTALKKDVKLAKQALTLEQNVVANKTAYRQSISVVE